MEPISISGYHFAKRLVVLGYLVTFAHCISYARRRSPPA